MRLAEEVVHNELPVSAEWFGIISLIVFALLLAITFAFRAVAHRHDPKAFVSHDSTESRGTGSH